MMTIQQIIATANDHVDTCGNDEDKVLALLGTVPADAHLKADFKFRGKTLAFDADDLSGRGKKIFNKFKDKLKTAVCDDFKYCTIKDEVDANLKKYLPDIVQAIIGKIPISNLPKWLVTILEFFGIAATSVDAVVAILVAWLIIKGCDALCQCE